MTVNSGLILCGGGLRGIYTSGVIDFFMDQGIKFPYVLGVSSGACNGFTYVSKQRGLGKLMYTKYINDTRYFSYKNLLVNKCLFGMDFIFDEIPNKLEKFDFDCFNQSKQRYIVTTTDCTTGKPKYYEKGHCNDIIMAIRASSSLPFISPIVNFDNHCLLDGGIANPIPIDKSIADGNKKHVVVLTTYDYYCRPFKKIQWIGYKLYPKYKNLVQTLCQQDIQYSYTLNKLKELQLQKNVVMIKPSENITMNMLGRNPNLLTQLYDLGYRNAEASYRDIEQLLCH